MLYPARNKPEVFIEVKPEPDPKIRPDLQLSFADRIDQVRRVESLVYRNINLEKFVLLAHNSLLLHLLLQPTRL